MSTGTAPASRAVHEFDITSPDFKRDPFPTLRAVREAGPLVRVKMPFIGGTWLATTHAAADEVLRDHHRFVRDPKRAGQKRVAGAPWWFSWMPRSFRVLMQNMLTHDEPEHRRLRGLVEQAFLRRSVEELREPITRLVETQLDVMESLAARSSGTGGADGGVDFVEHFARPVPLAVICELLGLPEEDRPKFSKWAAGLTHVNGLFGLLAALPGLFKLTKYLQREIDRRKASPPAAGLVSALVHAEQDGDRLNDDELLAMVFLLLLAGHETTVHLLANGVITLLEQPGERARLEADWTRAETAVDEILRYTTPIQFTKPRFVAHDLELCGTPLQQGELVMPFLASANTDPAKFENPEAFDVHRDPNPHLAFGTGIHVCLGLKLARAEAGIAFERLFGRFPDLGLAVPAANLDWIKRLGTRGVGALPLRLR